MGRVVRLGRAAALTLVALLVGALSPAPALAHSELTSSTPTDGAVVRAAPRLVTLVFGERVQARFSRVAVTGPDGRAAGVGDPTVAGARIDQPISIAADGAYTVSYRVVSADGHTVQGQLRFAVSRPATPQSPSPSAPSPTQSSDAGSPAPAVSPSTAGGARGERNGSGWGSLVVLGPMLIALAAIAVVLGTKPRRPPGLPDRELGEQVGPLAGEQSGTATVPPGAPASSGPGAVAGETR